MKITNRSGAHLLIGAALLRSVPISIEREMSL
jgi:hypothetical protein